MQLPLFPAGLTALTDDIAFQRQDGKVVYFYGHLPVYSHPDDDLKGFRLFTNQLLEQGTVRPADIGRALGVPPGHRETLPQAVPRAGRGRLRPAPRRRGATVLNSALAPQVRALLDEAKSVPEVSRASGVRANRLHKATRAGRLHAVKKSPSAGFHGLSSVFLLLALLALARLRSLEQLRWGPAGEWGHLLGLDLVPDPQARTLTVYPQHLTQAAHDAAAGYLCEEPTATETVFAGTELRMVYRIGSPQTKFPEAGSSETRSASA